MHLMPDLGMRDGWKHWIMLVNLGQPFVCFWNPAEPQSLHLQLKATLITSAKSDKLEFLCCSTDPRTFFRRMKNSTGRFSSILNKSSNISFIMVMCLRYLFSAHFWLFLWLKNKSVVSSWYHRISRCNIVFPPLYCFPPPCTFWPNF